MRKSMRTKKITWITYLSILLFGFSFWAGCKKSAQPSPKPNKVRKAAPKAAPTSQAEKTPAPNWKKRGKKIFMAAFGKLSSNLMKAMKKGGVPAAISTCTTKAGPLTKEVADKFKVDLQRISHKARNPKNQASESELEIIKAYSALLQQKKPLKPVVKKHENKVTVYAPIAIKMKACLKCHGTPGKELKKKHLALIKKHYPKDQAVGFGLGQLRGLWKVTFTTKTPTK